VSVLAVTPMDVAVALITACWSAEDRANVVKPDKVMLEVNSTIGEFWEVGWAEGTGNTLGMGLGSIATAEGDSEGAMLGRAVGVKDPVVGDKLGL
jgi:hypothetical protein